MKTVEEIIKDVVGIKEGAAPTTPMDYNECKMCMKEYAKQCIEKCYNDVLLPIQLETLKEQIDAQ